MLPTLALIKGEKVVDYVVGFDQLGGNDDFSTGVCEELPPPGAECVRPATTKHACM